MISAAIYGHGGSGSGGSSVPDRYELVKDTERIEKVSNDLKRHVTENHLAARLCIDENCAEPITEIHLVIKVPYKYELVGNGLKVREYNGK